MGKLLVEHVLFLGILLRTIPNSTDGFESVIYVAAVLDFFFIFYPEANKIFRQDILRQ